jgi:hypothetical protein
MPELPLTRKCIALCATVLWISISAHGQKIAAPEPITTPSSDVRCRYGTKFITIPLDVSFAFRSSSDAQAVVESELGVAGGLSGSVTAKAALVDNAEACLSGDAYYILFNPRWFVRAYNDGGGEYWFDRAVIAHELGHIWYNHFIKALGSNPRIELEADEFAGQVLARLGADLEQAKAPFRSDRLKPPHGDLTHPPVAERLRAVETGWRSVNTASDWVAGTPHPTAPHIIASKEKGKWTPAAGYSFLNDVAGDFTVRWTPGKSHPTAPHVSACTQEGNWCHEAGYDWVTSASNDLRVIWKEGKTHPTAPHVSACAEERTWCPDAGYAFINNVPGDFQVKWSPGKSHPTAPHVSACTQVERWCVDPGYTWVDPDEPALRVRPRNP